MKFRAIPIVLIYSSRLSYKQKGRRKDPSRNVNKMEDTKKVLATQMVTRENVHDVAQLLRNPITNDARSATIYNTRTGDGIFITKISNGYAIEINGVRATIYASTYRVQVVERAKGTDVLVYPFTNSGGFVGHIAHRVTFLDDVCSDYNSDTIEVLY